MIRFRPLHHFLVQELCTCFGESYVFVKLGEIYIPVCKTNHNFYYQLCFSDCTIYKNIVNFFFLLALYLPVLDSYWQRELPLSIKRKGLCTCTYTSALIKGLFCCNKKLEFYRQCEHVSYIFCVLEWNKIHLYCVTAEVRRLDKTSSCSSFGSSAGSDELSDPTDYKYSRTRTRPIPILKSQFRQEISPLAREDPIAKLRKAIGILFDLLYYSTLLSQVMDRFFISFPSGGEFPCNLIYIHPFSYCSNYCKSRLIERLD